MRARQRWVKDGCKTENYEYHSRWTCSYVDPDGEVSQKIQRELYKRVNYLKRLENTVEMDHLHTHTHTHTYTQCLLWCFVNTGDFAFCSSTSKILTDLGMWSFQSTLLFLIYRDSNTFLTCHLTCNLFFLPRPISTTFQSTFPGNPKYTLN